MDSGTHIVMGITLGALATLDPAISSTPGATEGIMLATLIGSKAPDIDTVFKLNNNAQYIRNHRGRTHSIVAIVIWSLLITIGIHLFFPQIGLFSLLAWSFIAVVLHVLTDVFNAYGTQALRPFSSKWIAFGIIGTFDIAIFSMHALAILLFFITSYPIGKIACIAYVCTILYYFIRVKMHYDVKKRVRTYIPTVRIMNITPAIHPFKYHVAAITKDKTYILKVKHKHVEIVDSFTQQPLPHTPIIEAALKDENVIAFLTFSPHYRYDVTDYGNHIEVRFMDLRYYSKQRYPFIAIVQLDPALHILDSYTGWIFKEHKLKNKLKIKPK